MGLIANVVANTPILSSWGNLIRDRTVMDFANVAERTSQWVAPPEGAMSYLRDTDRVEKYIGTAWIPIANAGILAYAEQTTGQVSITNTTVDLTGMTSTALTVAANRRIRISAQIMYNPGAVAAVGVLLLADGANAQIQQQNIFMTTPNQNYSVYAERIITPAAGTYTWKARGQADAGHSITSTTSTTFPGVFTVEDVGAV